MAKPFAVRLSREADIDLTDIYNHTTLNFGESQAVSYLGDIATLFDELSLNPEMGRERLDIRKGLRSFPKNRHVIFCRMLGDSIRIVRVLAMSQDVGRAFK